MTVRPADPVTVQAAVQSFRAGVADDSDVRLLVVHLLAMLARVAPGRAVELRVPPYAAVQVVAGPSHKRGRPPAVVETDPQTWIGLALGDLAWADALRDGRISATGERCDLSSYLPLPVPPAPGSEASPLG